MREVNLRYDSVCGVLAVITELTHEFGGTIRARSVSQEHLEMVFRFTAAEPFRLMLPFRYGWYALKCDQTPLEARETVVRAGQEVTWTQTLTVPVSWVEAP